MEGMEMLWVLKGISALALWAGFMVVMAGNAVHSVIYLGGVFCCGAAILLLLKVEYMGMMYVVVYVGALAVLFMFVVMMLGKEGQRGSSGSIGRGGMSVSLAVVIGWVWMWEVGDSSSMRLWLSGWEGELDGIGNIGRMGQLLYTERLGEFLAGGLLLLVAMLGGIMMVMEDREGEYTMRGNSLSMMEGKRQRKASVEEAVRRSPRGSVFMLEYGGKEDK